MTVFGSGLHRLSRPPIGFCFLLALSCGLMTRISFSLIALSTKIDLLFHYLPGFGERLDKRLSLWISSHRLMITRWFFLGFD